MHEIDVKLEEQSETILATQETIVEFIAKYNSDIIS